MKNKKLYVIVSLVLAVQLLVCVGFALWNGDIHKNCDNEENLYTIKIRNVQLTEYWLELYLYDYMDDIWNKKLVPVTDENGNLTLKTKENSDKTDNYFYYGGKMGFDMIETDCIVYPEGKTFKDCRAFLNSLLPEGAEFFLSESTKPVYLTAYIYKGVFLPHELYVDGELVLMFDKDKALT